MKDAGFLFALALVAAARAAAAYTWPNPQMEALDALHYEQTGQAGAQSAQFVFPCTPTGFLGVGGSNSGRINAADWLRTAYHDMATHNATAGTGGLDASIQFADEQNRPENIGDGTQNTLGIIGVFVSRYVSLSDAIAFGAVVAVEACGGDYIPFRGGRIDATEAGPPGVPQPQDTLASHKATFARQGFTAEEMIQLVACGHSLGGVQHTAFPTIAQVSGTANNTSGNMFFDTTFEVYDNKIATDYISGHSVDPLVVGPNITTRSDARIFASDGNATMRAFAASNTLFKATCSALFSRMLDTVPRGVKLTEEVLPLPAKPAFLVLTRNLNGTLTVSTSIRLWNMQEDPSRVVKFVWAGANSKPCTNCSFTMAHDPTSDFSTFLPGNIMSLFFNLPGVAFGVSNGNEGQVGLVVGGDTTKFWLESTQQGHKTVFDQSGLGFPLTTTALLTESSCFSVAFSDNGAEIMTLFAEIGVVKGANPSAISVQVSGKDYGEVQTFPATLNRTASASNAHIDLWTVNIVDSDFSILSNAQALNTVAEIGGHNISSTTSNFNSFKFQQCSGSAL